MATYLGEFDSYESLDAFETHLPPEESIIVAEYDCPPYEGYAFVLYQEDGKLYEVNASHCSCNGLEGTFEPEETTINALRIRFYNPSFKSQRHKEIWEAISKGLNL